MLENVMFDGVYTLILGVFEPLFPLGDPTLDAFSLPALLTSTLVMLNRFRILSHDLLWLCTLDCLSVEGNTSTF